jgi:hypothetical protein
MDHFWLIDAYKRENGNRENKKGILSTNMVNKALEIAFNAQKERVDRTGRPFILRTLNIAEQMQGEFPVCAALLHDALQNDITFDELSDAGFHDKIITVIKILVRDSTTSFIDHVQKIKDSGNSIAISITLAELIYDSDVSKFIKVDEQIVDWYHQCMQAMAILESSNVKTGWRNSAMQYIYNAVSTRVIDIQMNAPSIGGRLSNLTRRSFVFYGIECASIEGVLQSLKLPDPIQQYETCRLFGFQARKAGKNQDWQAKQELYWMEKTFPRDSQEYQELLNTLYKAAFDDNAKFREDLAFSKGYKLTHRIGSDDPTKTILTKDEFISRLEWLRDMIVDM